MWTPDAELVDTLATRLRMPEDRVRALLAGSDDRPKGVGIAAGIELLERHANGDDSQP